MKTVARVHDVGQGRLRLVCDSPASGCSGCAGGRGCAVRWLARPGGPTLDLAEPGPGADRFLPGEAVVVEVDDGELLRAAMLAYLPPLAGLMAGPAVVAVLGYGSELTAMAAALAGLLLGWGVSRFWLGRSPPRYRIRPEGRS